MNSRKLLEEVRRTGLTQAEIAKELGILQASVSKLERGQTKELRGGAFARLLSLHTRVVNFVEQLPVVDRVNGCIG